MKKYESVALSVFIYWIPIAIVTTILAGVIYACVQQTIRLSADDPQIQIAEDTALALSRNPKLQQLYIPKRSTDISMTLAPFIMIFDDRGKLLGSSGNLQGKAPVVPSGVLQFAKEHGEERFTWQPADGVRIATVLVHYQGATSGYVLLGRSLREVERRELAVELFVAAGWLATLGLSFFATIILQLLPLPKRK